MRQQQRALANSTGLVPGSGIGGARHPAGLIDL
jgi:hypothetical protein